MIHGPGRAICGVQGDHATCGGLYNVSGSFYFRISRRHNLFPLTIKTANAAVKCDPKGDARQEFSGMIQPVDPVLNSTNTATRWKHRKKCSKSLQSGE